MITFGLSSRHGTNWLSNPKTPCLLDRIIKASSNEGEVVLDPFAGCATACAAERLGRQWVGIDISEKAAELVQVRIRKEINLYHKFEPIRRSDVPQPI